MTDKKPKQKSPGFPPQYVEERYKDDSGIPRVVLLPPGEKDKKTGIPLSLDLSSLFGHMPKHFQSAFYQALHDEGLVKPEDYFQPGAAERYRRVILRVIKHDFLSIQALAKKEMTNGG
jgi:hypothetical protein